MIFLALFVSFVYNSIRWVVLRLLGKNPDG